MLYNDFKNHPEMAVFQDPEHREALARTKGMTLQDSYQSKELDKTFEKMAKPMYDTKVEPGTLLPCQLGNSYTASMYTGLLSLLDYLVHKPDQGRGEEVLMFSYGSGLAATMFGLRIRGDISHIVRAVDLRKRLEERVFLSPTSFQAALLAREGRYKKKGYIHGAPQEGTMFPGTFYLAGNDEFGRRNYSRTDQVPVTHIKSRL